MTLEMRLPSPDSSLEGFGSSRAHETDQCGLCGVQLCCVCGTPEEGRKEGMINLIPRS